MTVPAPLLDMFQRYLCAYTLRVGDKDFLFNPTENWSRIGGRCGWGFSGVPPFRRSFMISDHKR